MIRTYYHRVFCIVLAVITIGLVTGCQNSRSFTFGQYTCASLRLNETSRQTACLDDEVRDNCPQTCGLCCEDDDQYEFKINDISTSTELGNCTWLGKSHSLLYFCDEFLNGRMVKDACSYSCRFCMPFVNVNPDSSSTSTADGASTPTGAPTISPSPTISVSPTVATCEEEQDFRIDFNQVEYSCRAIRYYESVRQDLCTTETVRNACPSTCGLCCVDNIGYLFNITDGGKDKDCKWVGKTEARKNRMCDRHRSGSFIRDECMETCSFCKNAVIKKKIIERGSEKDLDKDNKEGPAALHDPKDTPASDKDETSLVLAISFGVAGAALLCAIARCLWKKGDRLEDNVQIVPTNDGQTKLIIRSSSSSTTDSSNSHESYFPKLGVKLSYLDEFIDKCGGQRKLKGLCTTDINEKFVKPMTEEKKISLCGMLQDEKHGSVGHATIFVSHAWQYEFLNVVNALQYHLRETPHVVIWFDLFSINQHDTKKWSQNWWSTTFMSEIKEIGHTVMVMSPWNDPLPYTRTWCVFEAYCARVGKCKFELALNAKDREQLVKDMENTPNIESMLGDISVEKSQASRQEDKEMIFKVLKESVGFRSANEIVFDQMRRWVIEMAKEELEKGSEDEGRIWKLLHMLGTQFQGQGKLELSKQLLEKCLQQQKDTLGLSHTHTLSTLQNLADLYSKLGMYDKAKRALEDVFIRRKSILGATHQDTISTYHSLAAVHLVLRDYSEAKRIYEEVLEVRRSTLGPSHPLTLNTLNNLAMLYKDNDNYDQAKVLYEEVLQRRKSVLGETHPKTLSTLHNLASLYDYLGKQFEAKIMFENCLSHQRETLGDSHPDTLGTMNNLAVLYHKEGEHAKAAEMYEECLKYQKATLGEDHPDTLGTVHNLALLYENQRAFNHQRSRDKQGN